MFTSHQYLGSIERNLEKHSELLIGNLKKVLDYKFHSEVDLLDFSASIEPTRFELSITMFSMDDEGSEVYEDGPHFSGSEDILPEIEYHQLDSDQVEDFFEFYEKNEETLVPLEQKTFTDWFTRCWKEAGGDALNLPSYFVFHDDYKSYDLTNDKWVDDEDKWS